MSAAPATDEKLTPLKIGALMPTLSGEYLTGRRAVLPDAARGKTALLALGFTYDSRHAVEAWVERFRKEFGKEPGITFYEVPMIGGAARLGRWFIDSGMRKGTPKELHENVITVYGGVAPWKQRLNFRAPDAAYLILLDPQGNTNWLYSGRFDETAFQELSRRVRQSVPARP